MTLEELDALQEDTRKLPRVSDRAEQQVALALIEVARQLVILNATLAKAGNPGKKSAKRGK